MRSQRKIRCGKQIAVGCLNILLVILFLSMECQASEVIRYRDLNKEKHIRIYVDQSGSIRSQEKTVKDIVELLYNMFYLEEEIDCEIYGFNETTKLIGVNQLKTENVKEELFKFNGQKTNLKEVMASIDGWKQEGECYAIIVSDMYDSESQNETVLKQKDECGVKTYVIEWDNPKEAESSEKICIEGAEHVYVPDLYDIKSYEKIKKDVLCMAAQIYYDTDVKWETGEEIYRRQDETDEFFFSSTNEIENDILYDLVKLERNLSGGGYLYYLKNIPASKILDELNISFRDCDFLILPQICANIREEDICKEKIENEK